MITIREIWARVINMLSHVTVGKTSTTGKMATVDARLFAAQSRTIAVMQHFGFASAMPDNSEAIVGMVKGDANSTIAIATHHRESYPSGLTVGQTMIYHQDGITFVKLLADGNIEINRTGAVGTVVVNGSINIVGDVTVTGNITAIGNIIGANFP
jgi:phage gp45-like